MLALLADYLVVKFYVYVGIFVPPHFVESVTVELFESGELLLDKLVDGIAVLLAALSIGQSAEINNMVAHPRHYLHTVVGQDVHLFHKVSPQFFACYCLAERRHIIGGIARIDVAGGNYQVAGVIGTRHNLLVVVDIIVGSAVRFNPCHGHTLRHIDVEMAVLRLVTGGSLYERSLFQFLGNLSCVYGVDVLLDGVEFRRHEPPLYLLRIDETAGVAVGYVDVHFGAL